MDTIAPPRAPAPALVVIGSAAEPAGARLPEPQLLDALPDAKRVLEIGCGDGTLGQAYKQTHPDCVWHGLDRPGIPLDLARTRLDRVDDVRVLDEPSSPPPGVHLRDVDAGLYQPGPGTPVVRLRLARTARWVAEYYPVEDVRELEDGGLAVAVRTADVAWAKRLVASLGGAATVEEPAELAAAVAADARAALTRYPADGQLPATSAD